jgi:hypothetical protein
MMPSMQIHLHETNSLDQLTRQYASNQLDLHMTVLTEMQKTYWAANMQYELFSRARAATKTLPASHAGPSQPMPTVAVTVEESLPFHHNNIMGTPWSPYLNIPVELGLSSHHPSFAVNPSLDFFSPVPSMPVANGATTVGHQSHQMDDAYV